MTGAPPPLWTAEEAARATGGRCRGHWSASGVSIDSRTLVPGDLFVALQGFNSDGHAFVADALARGAAAALVAYAPVGGAADAPLLLVADTFAGLRALGAAARGRSRARIAGITGSVGKTGIKEALALVLHRQAETYASVGSFNNHWGVPLSLARLPRNAAFGVFEMGMNHAGEITSLTRLVRPHVAAITTVEPAHIEHFASVEEIADAKAEIFDGLEPGGTAVLNRDNIYCERLIGRARGAGAARIITFGRAGKADVRLIAAVGDEAGSQIEAEVLGERLSFRIGAPGQHWQTNALCVLACVAALSADVGAAAAALVDLRPPRGRGQRTTVRLTGGSFELIDDSYNASPASMRASFQVLGASRPGPGGRRIAAVGDMLELGPESPRLHAGLATALVENGIDLVFTAGPTSTHLHEALAAPMRGAHAENSEALAPVVAEQMRAGDVIAVKGSAGSRMRLVVEALLGLDQGRQSEQAGTAPGPGK